MANHHYNGHRTNERNGSKPTKVVVVMVPFPAQGHLNQLLHLCRLISSYNIPIHYVSNTTYTQKAKSRLQGWDSISTANIVSFHEFDAPSFLPPPPTPNGSVKVPALFQPSIEAAAHLREPVAKLLHTLSPTAERIVLIHDFLVSSTVQDVVSVPNAEAYAFHGVSAFHAFSHLWEMFGKPPIIKDEAIENLPTIESAFSQDFVEHINKNMAHLHFNCGIIYDGCRLLEGKYIDLIASAEIIPNLKQWALGPFNPVAIDDNNDDQNQRHKCLKWLDEQAPNSVIYVCFGTTVSLSNKQVEELANGLEKSDQKFIWVLRGADKEVLYQEEEGSAELPKGYEERVAGKQGMIIRDWAPQLEILAHPSTGGFLSHCGWNSCMESLTMGVPIAAWPMHSDQPRNTALITKGLKTGIVVRDWALGDKLVTSLAIEKAVRKLMATKEGEEIRRRTAELSDDVKASVAKGGVTTKELDSFIAHITRLI